MMTIRNPEDSKAMRDALANLFTMQAYLQYMDFIAANPGGKKYDSKGRELPCNAYTFSAETSRARDVFMKARKITWSDESEKQIHSFLEDSRESGVLRNALAWESEKPSRLKKNPWRSGD